MTPQATIGDWRMTIPPAPAGSEPRAAPTLSVLITYYRGKDVVCDAVRSVLEQTVPAHEIVICDDGSPDNLEEALGELCEQVKIVHKQNGGTGSALNAACAVATGEYVVQLDQDDAFKPRRLEAIAATIAERPDVDIVASDADIELGERLVTTMEAVNPYPASDQRLAMMQTCVFIWPAVRRSLVLEAGGWDEQLGAIEDWDFWLRLVLGGAVVAYIHEPLYRWRLTEGSRSSSSRVTHVEDQVRLTEKALEVPGISAQEADYGRALLAGRKRLLAREHARDAVEAGSKDARSRSLPLVTGAGFDRATRAKAAITVLSPALAARFLARRREHTDPAIRALEQRGFRF